MDKKTFTRQKRRYTATANEPNETGLWRYAVSNVYEESMEVILRGHVLGPYCYKPCVCVYIHIYECMYIYIQIHTYLYDITSMYTYIYICLRHSNRVEDPPLR